jgi:hypothetical protein
MKSLMNLPCSYDLSCSTNPPFTKSFYDFRDNELCRGSGFQNVILSNYVPNQNGKYPLCASLQKLQLFDETLLTSSFNNLPVDRYLQQPYRQRRFSRFQVAAEQCTLLSHTSFCQTSESNPLFGNLDRQYAGIDDAVRQSVALHQLIRHFIRICNLADESVEVGVHQIRITCSQEQVGNPVPEGVHRDGYAFVGIYCVERKNVSGGITFLYQERKSKPCLSIVLQPTTFLIFDDQAFLHFTSPIHALTDSGYRDVFILTAYSVSKD